MIYRIFPSKDTFITNYVLNSVPRTGSNFGACEILHLFKVAGISGSVGYNSSASLARILTQFDISEFQQLFSDGTALQASSSFYLKLTDTQHDQTLPTSFDVEVQAVSEAWDEGRGFDVDGFTDKGYANWVKSRSNVYWAVTGSSGTGPIKTQHFDSGHENLEIDVTDIVAQWLTGSITNNGFLVKLSSSQENDNLDYYIKMFHGRETFFKDKRPYLEMRWNDFVGDDRNNFFFDVSGTLFLHRRKNGVAENISSIGTGSIGVRIADASGTVGLFTGSWAGVTGDYKVTFSLPSASYSGSSFHDIWFNLNNTSEVFLTGTFGVGDSLNSQTLTKNDFFVNVQDLKSSYLSDEDVRLNLFIRRRDYNPARVLTASLDARGMVIDKCYYSIVNDRTKEAVIPWGTGSFETTRLSYDENGNYFNLRMANLSRGSVYRILFMMIIDGKKIIVDGDDKFKIV